MEMLIRRLARVDAGELPVLSVYLDVRPEATGEKPETREGLVVLRDRLREIRRTFLPRGAALDSFDADAARIDAFVTREMQPSTEGVAIFACHSAGVWETAEVTVPFTNQVTAAPRPDLYQLAKLQDEYETSVIGVLDSNTARLFVYQFGALLEAGGPDDDPENYRRTDVGGWSQARYQRHIDTHRMHFAKEIARALDDLVEREGATRVVLAGDEVVMESLRPELSRQVADKIAGTFRVRIGEGVKEIEAEAVPILRQAERDEDLSVVERLVARVRGGHLGISGVEATKRALQRGQVHVLVIDEAHAPADARAELVRLAAATDAAVEIVREVPPMADMEGVGALLRFQFYV